MIPNPGTRECTFFMCPLQNTAHQAAGLAVPAPQGPLGEGLCYLWAEAPAPRLRCLCLKKWSQNFHKAIVFLFFPIKGKCM